MSYEKQDHKLLIANDLGGPRLLCSSLLWPSSYIFSLSLFFKREILSLITQNPYCISFPMSIWHIRIARNYESLYFNYCQNQSQILERASTSDINIFFLQGKSPASTSLFSTSNIFLYYRIGCALKGRM